MAAGSPNHLISILKKVPRRSDPRYEAWKQAWVEFYQYHAPRLQNTVAAQFPDLWNDAPDIAQVTMTKFFKNIRKIDPEGGVTSYLNKTAHNTAIDLIRKKRPKQPIPEEQEDPKAATAQKQTEARLTLEMFLARLSLEDRKLVEMHHLEGHTLQETSDSTGIPVSTVQARISRALFLLSRFARGGELGA